MLTPDNYAENVAEVDPIGQEKRMVPEPVHQLPRHGDDFTEFKLLITALKKQIDDGLEVRIICRDMMKQESMDVLVALGFPREVFRFQPACHNKTIIVDGKVVMFGSHNWSNEGSKDEP